MKTTDFIKKANEVHGNKYQYIIPSDKVLARGKVNAICPKHGEVSFNVYEHLKGRECIRCSYEKRGQRQTDTKEQFIEKARKVHGDKYDYSKVEYVKSSEKVCIICPEHGEFWQSPNSHLSGGGCPSCARLRSGGTQRHTIEGFIKMARDRHGDKYDYSKIEYVNYNTKLNIVCPIHGDIWQTPVAHLKGVGCPKCRYEKMSKSNTLTTEEFIERAREIHGDVFDYSQVEYNGYEEHVKIICPIHGEFWQSPDSHLHSSGCPQCGGIFSHEEDAICQFLETLGLKVRKHNRKAIYPFEIDLHVEDKNIAIEYDGLYWHSDMVKEDINYHLNKTAQCEKLGIRLIHVFEDEWLNNSDIVKAKLKHIFGCDGDLPKIYGRQCVIKDINNKLAESFLSKNHIQGFVRSSVYLGCFKDGEIIGVMSFRREKNGTDKWELTRFATDITKRCIGVGGKMFKHFTRNYDPSEVKTFADRRWSSTLSENLYDKIGFKFDGFLNPDYSYYYPKEVKDRRIHKFNCRKKLLLKKHPDELTEDMTEYEMTKKMGYFRIWDCGLIRYKWFKEK